MSPLVRVLVIDQAWARAQRPRPDFSSTVKKSFAEAQQALKNKI